MSNYEEKQEARREGLLNRADKARAEAAGARAAEDRIGSVIPLGQPA